MDNPRTPLHQWTHEGDKVLLVKCLPKGGKGHGGFQWPRAGPVRCPRAQADRQTAATVTNDDVANCQSGGLFGWAWGVNLGGGREPDYQSDWLVFAARPEDVVALGGKHKAVGECEVVYYGDALGALIHTLKGRVAWVEHNSAGSAAATGESGSAAATGWRGSAAATGWSGSAAATGESGSAAATGGRGSAAATGERGSAAATGESGSAAATGGRGSAAATGGRGSAAATGWSGSAAATGGSGSAAATGWRGVAALTGEDGTIEVGPTALGAVTAKAWYWRVHAGAAVAWRWENSCGLLKADDLNVADGTVVRVMAGQVQGMPEGHP